VLYVVPVHFDLAGVRRKILHQVSALKTNGIDTRLLAVTSSLMQKNEDSADYLMMRSELSKSQLRAGLSNLLGRAIFDFSPDVLYLRWPGSGRVMLSILKACAGTPIISEHQTFEIRELWSTRSIIALFSELLFGRSMRKAMTGLVAVTNEISLHELKRCGDNNKPHIVNGNGIDVSSVPLRTPPGFDSKNLDLLCVAQVAKWHGLDRLIRGMAEYKGNVDVRLHIAGDGSEVPNLKRLVADLKLENSVVFHGFKTGEELDVLFDKCHIAAGSLGLHRVGVSEGSILKVREYCARGIPFIYGAMDSDFNEKFPYILRVPADESPIDLNAVFSFADSALSDTEHSVKMREYAKENLDWSIKMKKLIDFMNEILESKMRK